MFQPPGSEEMDDVFHQTVIDVIKRFSPDKKNVVISADCLQELKDVVRKNVMHSPKTFVNSAATHDVPYYQTIARRPSSDLCGEEEDSRMSCDSSEESRSNDDDSRSSCSRRITKSISTSSFEFNKSHKKMSRAKRTAELRAHRRKQSHTEDFEEFTCVEGEFPSQYAEWYQKVLDSSTNPVLIYHKIMNSVQRFFTNVTFESNVTCLMLEFMREAVVLDCSQMNEYYESAIRGYGEKEVDRRVLEAQVQALLEAHLLTIETEAKEVEEIVKKMRFIYIATDAARMKLFLEEPFADNFNHIIPKEMAMIFDELCIALPPDLEEFDPSAGQNLPNEVMNPCLRKLRARDEQVKQLKELLEETSIVDTAVNGKENKEKKVKAVRSDRKLVLPAAPAEPPESPVASRRRGEARMKIVMETPEEKLKSEEPEEVYDEVVKQTPMAKLRQQRKCSKRLSELVKLSEERTRPARAAAIASEKANRAIMSAQVAPNTSKESLFALNTPSPRPQRSARANLRDRFTSATPSSAPSTSSSSNKRSAARSKAEEIASPEKKRLRSSVGSPPPKPLEEIPGLGKDQILMYKRRMTDITKMKNPPGTVLSPNRPTRTGLFDESAVGGEKQAKVESASIQKNRTGREVRAGTTVHLAHILLNVHNPAPLSAFNASRMGNGTVPKLQKLVRMAKKSQKLRLQRLRNRVRLAQSQTSSSTAE